MQHNTSRRRSLVVLTLAMGAAFTSRSEANDPINVDLEATPYGGTSSGHLPSRGGCAFAPSAGVTYGGIGGRVRVRQRVDRADPTRGATVTVQGAAEYRSHELLAEGSDHQRALPDNRVMGAAGISVGYDWRYVGVHAGVIARQVYGEPSVPCESNSADASCLARATYPSTAVSIFPDVTVRGGPSDGLHGELGVGAYTPAMLTRPGVHLGVGYTTRSGWDAAARCGVTNPIGDDRAFRCDLSGAAPVGERVTVGLGGGVIDGYNRVDFDARATVGVRIGP